MTQDLDETAETEKKRPARRSYASSAPTRSRILDHAVRAFAERGFEGTSLRAVARAAGVDHSTLIHHFHDKGTLLREALRARDVAYLPEKTAEVVTVRVLADGLIQAARFAEGDEAASRLFSIMSAEAGVDGHPARDYLQDRHQVLLMVLGEAIRVQRASGNLGDNGLPPITEAARLIASWEGLEVFSRLHPSLANVPALWEATLEQALGLKEGEEGAVVDVDQDALEGIFQNRPRSSHPTSRG